MSYDPIAQADRDVLSERSDSMASRSPAPGHSLPPVPEDFENIGKPSIGAEKANPDMSTRLGSIIRSMASTATSYDMVEDDDYEEIQGTPVQEEEEKKKKKKEKKNTSTPPQPHSPSSSGTGRMRTASVGPRLPLRHPTPDLQSVQGAYLRNVERLEESAERLSMTSSLGDEVQKMKLEQRRLQRQTSAPVGNATSTPKTHGQVSAKSSPGAIVGIEPAAKAAGDSSPQQVDSPKGSIRSGSWTHASHPRLSTFKDSPAVGPLSDNGVEPPPQIHEHAHPLISSGLELPQPPPHTYQPENPPRMQSGEQSRMHDTQQADEIRPSTSASTDTYRQATSLFVDFDGVHYTSRSHLSLSRQGSTNRQIAIKQPPLAADAAAFNEPPPGERMVYYPAPVPMMLNLPQKLSKLPSAAERERRRLTALSAMPNETRRSAAWLNEKGSPVAGGGQRASQALSVLPPQLRASAFFDHPGLGQDIDIKGASAVDTLDSILDASAHAPVSAFTDHPFAGHLGREVYGTEKDSRKSGTFERKKKRRSSLSALLRTSTGAALDAKVPGQASSTGHSATPRNKLAEQNSSSSTGMLEGEAALAGGEGTALRNSAGPQNAARESLNLNAVIQEVENEEHEEDEEQDGEGDSDSDAGAYSGPPTTLLAELQMRKTQMKQRNRTAANAFPNGMHSTLLELDAVAQVQQKSRKKKHITLAWEDQEVADTANFDDEDVPLGLLVAGQKMQQNINRPMGLMEKREMEDNEPLSRRRARLRGEDMHFSSKGAFEQQRSSTMYTLDVPALSDKVLEERDEETLAQRIQRIKAEKEAAAGLGAEFMKEISSELGLKMENVAPTATTPEPEETLGQRRKRLQEEGLRNSRQPSQESAPNVLGLKARSSMADILSQHPAASARQPLSNAQHDSRMSYMSAFPPPMMNTFAMPGMMPSYASFNAGMPYLNGASGFSYNNPTIYSPGLAMQMGGYGQSTYMHDPSMMGGPLDPKQRDMIDRWRQSVAP